MARRVDISKRAQKIANRLTGLGMIRVMNRTVTNVRDYIKQRYMGGARTSPNRLARNTGAMERHTVATRAQDTGGTVRASIKVNVPYASIHFSDKGQKQTVIKPRNVTKLTVPILKNDQHRPPLPASGYRNKFAYNDILYAVRRNKFIFPIFSLRSSVTVPSRIDIHRDVEPHAKKVLEQELQNEIRTIVK